MKSSMIYLFSLLLLWSSCAGKFDEKTANFSTAANKTAELASIRQGAVETLSDDALNDDARAATASHEKPIEQKLIKTGFLSLQVEDYKASRAQVIAAIKAAQGYISKDDEENSSYRTGCSLVIRVPKVQFDSLVENLVSLATQVESKNIQVEDVTEEFVDIQARLKNKREVEKRYVEILQQAKTIKEILEVEEHLRHLREEIEAKEGRMKYLQSQVSLSTIHLDIYQRFTQASYSPSFLGQMGDAVVGGWKGLQTFVVGLVYIWPFLIIFALLIWWARRWLVRRKQNKV